MSQYEKLMEALQASVTAAAGDTDARVEAIKRELDADLTKLALSREEAYKKLNHGRQLIVEAANALEEYVDRMREVEDRFVAVCTAVSSGLDSLKTSRLVSDG